MRTYEDELLEEYYRGQTNGFNTGYANAVDKAVEWLKTHINDYLVKGRDIDYMFDDFRKAMEE